MKEKPTRRPLLFSIRLGLFAALSPLLTGTTVPALTWVPVGPPGNPVVTAMATARPDYALVFSPPHAHLYAATAGAAVFRSDDGGANWTSTGPGLAQAPRALAVRQVFHMGVDTGSYDTTVFAATGGGVLRLLPGASGWTASNSGLTSLDVRSLAVAGNGVVSGSSPVPVYAGTADGLFASSDGGGSWVRKAAGLPSGSDAAITALASDPSDPAVLYAGTGKGAFRSADGGETWVPLEMLSPPYRLSVRTIAVDPLVPSRVFAAGVASPDCTPACLGPSFDAAMRSADGGRSWDRIDDVSLFGTQAFAATPNLPSAVFAGTADGRVFESPDGGAAWSAATDGLGLRSVSSLVIDPAGSSFVFAGGDSGVFCAALAQTSSGCSSDATTSCLDARRFAVSVDWREPGGKTGNGLGSQLTDNAAAFWFFSPNSLELAVKIVDGRSIDAKWWVFYGSLTDVEFTLTIRDMQTGAVRTYFKPQGLVASLADTSAF